MVSKSGSRISATADNSAESGQPAVFRKAITPIARSWKLVAGGLALAGAALIGVTFVVMNRAPDPSQRELSVVATEGPVRPQSGQTVEPSNGGGPLMQGHPTD
jgi:hypothetical protein